MMIKPDIVVGATIKTYKWNMVNKRKQIVWLLLEAADGKEYILFPTIDRIQPLDVTNYALTLRLMPK